VFLVDNGLPMEIIWLNDMELYRGRGDAFEFNEIKDVGIRR